MERDIITDKIITAAVISTHTLTWSVTVKIGVVFRNDLISTHTLTWSVNGHVILDPSEKPISTHTLTWSVTLSSYPITNGH